MPHPAYLLVAMVTAVLAVVYKFDPLLAATLLIGFVVSYLHFWYTITRPPEATPAPDPGPEISVRVSRMDGAALELAVPSNELVSEVKRTIGQVRLVGGLY